MSQGLKNELKIRGRQWRQRSTYLASRIVRDPATLDGAAYIRGTNVTVAEIRAAWAERGVRLNDLRKRFRKLDDDDIEAALFHAKDPSDVPERLPASYIAEWEGPPHRKLYLHKVSNDPSLLFWRLDVSEFDDDGEELPLGDVVENSFDQIIRYPENYAPRDIIWRDEYTDGIVDIYSMKDT
jgi:uncharacterized protein (DUF433 family)